MNTSLTILVVEDEPSDYELLELSFSRAKANCRVRWARDGLDAVEQLSGDVANEPVPDLIITDLNMPRMTGHEVIAWVKAQTGLRCIPVVVMSSSNQATDVENAYAAGASGYFFKPTDFETLTEICAQICRYWKLARLFAPAVVRANETV